MWKCNKCGAIIERLVICWGTSGGEKVDMIDYFCPKCPSGDLTFQGSKEEKDAYWNAEWRGDFKGA